MKRKRTVKGYTKISKAAGYSLSHVSRVMRGQRQPTMTCAARLSKAMGLTMDELAARLKIK